MEPMHKTEEEWKQELTPEQYHIMREKGTEAAFTGAYWDVHEDGIYRCAACGLPLFKSEAKYDSGTGWPSFYEPVNEDSVAIEKDTSHGMTREEVVCGRCGAHLGHRFPDGPEDKTGERYCMNSASLHLEQK